MLHGNIGHIPCAQRTRLVTRCSARLMRPRMPLCRSTPASSVLKDCCDVFQGLQRRAQGVSDLQRRTAPCRLGGVRQLLPQQNCVEGRYEWPERDAEDVSGTPPWSGYRAAQLTDVLLPPLPKFLPDVFLLRRVIGHRWTQLSAQ